MPDDSQSSVDAATMALMCALLDARQDPEFNRTSALHIAPKMMATLAAAGFAIMRVREVPLTPHIPDVLTDSDEEECR